MCLGMGTNAVLGLPRRSRRHSLSADGNCALLAGPVLLQVETEAEEFGWLGFIALLATIVICIGFVAAKFTREVVQWLRERKHTRDFDKRMSQLLWKVGCTMQDGGEKMDETKTPDGRIRHETGV